MILTHLNSFVLFKMHIINIQLSFCLIVNYSIRSSPFSESHQFHLLWCQSELPFLTLNAYREYTIVDIIGPHNIPLRIIRASIKFISGSTRLMKLKLHFFNTSQYNLTNYNMLQRVFIHLILHTSTIKAHIS